MSYLFHLIISNGDVFLSINDNTVIKPKRMFGLMDFASAKRVAIAAPCKGSWIPYIEFSNIFSKGTKSIGVSQAMADQYEIIDIIPVFGATEEVISGDGFEVKYVKGVGKRHYTFLPKKKAEIEEVFIVREVRLNGSIILDKLEFIPKYNIYDKPNSVIDFVSMIYELGQEIKGELILEKSKLI